MTFAELGLKENYCQNLLTHGISAPTPIQAEVFLPITEGRSVLGLSKTGTGKTLGYMAPLVQRFGESQNKVLVLVPTRELATQVQSSLESLTAGSQKAVVIVGGESEDRQIADSRNSGWIIATPGRLLDLLKRRMIDVGSVKGLVFDEADRLLDMGFIDDIRELAKYLPPGMQMLFFSATLHFGVDEMAYELGADFLRFGQESEQATVEGLDHRVAFVGDEEKFHVIAHFLKDHGDQRGIIFSNYRERAHEMSYRLRGLGFKIEGMTAQLAQGARVKIMDAFRNGSIQVLVASDLAARGLDIFDLDFVVNYDLPEDPSTYVHRVGRTARAGKKGIALSLVGFEDSFRLERLEKFLGHAVQRQEIQLNQLSGPMPRIGQPDRQQESRPRQQESRPRQHESQGPARRPTPQVNRPQVQRPATVKTQPVPVVAPAPKGFISKLMIWIKSLFGKAPVVVKPKGPAVPPRHSNSGRGRGSFSGDRRRSSRPGSSSGSRSRHRPRSSS